MSRVAAGELDCMRVLFERYQAWIYNFLFQMVQDRDASEDLAQSTFYKVMKHRSSYNGGKFTPWIFQIARNLGMDYFREAKHKMAPMDSIPEIADTVEEKEDMIKLKLALQKLPEADRELLIMSRFHSMKYAQIAEVINSTEAAVKVKIHRAVKKLRTVYFESVEI
jgi:RNA polymerase sigma factor (sigma-70 family)